VTLTNSGGEPIKDASTTIGPHGNELWTVRELLQTRESGYDFASDQVRKGSDGEPSRTGIAKNSVQLVQYKPQLYFPICRF